MTDVSKNVYYDVLDDIVKSIIIRGIVLLK